MNKNLRLIISVSSDIGFNLAKKWINDGYTVYGTFRSQSKNIKELKKIGVKLFRCDLNNNLSIDNFVKKLRKIKWNVLVFAAGTQKPIGEFKKIKFLEWEKSISINFVKQFKILHNLLPLRYKNKNPIVIFFAGGGTNNATLNYSSYTISKIACIKMCELLDAEIKDTRFTAIGPGWVKTKFHKQTLKSKSISGENYFRTLKKFKDDNFYPMSKVIKCCDWLISSDRNLVGGRNFSAASDPWENKKINNIKKNDNYFKLRRYGNNIFKKLNN